MKRHIFFVIAFFYSANIFAQSDTFKIRNIACERGAEKFSNMAKAVGDQILQILEKTAPSSKERKDALKTLNETEEKLKDEWFAYSKKSIQVNRENKSPNTMDSMLWEYYWETYIFTITLTFGIPSKEPGKSELTYRRMIEEECKAIGGNR
jgi:hypothetical protein